MRAVIPVVFICLAVAVAFGVKTLLEIENGDGDSTSGESKDQERKILPDDGADSFEELTQTPGAENNADEDLDLVAIGLGEEPETELRIESIDDGIAALALLEKFLEMESLDERMPYLETKSSKEELEESVLNGSLPEALSITVDVRETNSIEQMVDFYYHVDFRDENGGVDPQTMLIRKRGEQEPKVVVDPFLDMFGGRFERFAAKPSNESGTFQVIASAGAYCYDDVPGSEKKFTLKILSKEDTKGIAKAYFGKQSKIGRMLEDETSGFAYGQAKPCTIFMRWNTEEDPPRPFLEALDIKALNWNP